MHEKKLFLLDAMALIYRAYFAFNKNPRMNAKGMNTSAIFGFANVLLDLLKREKPTHIGVAFDTMAPTVRKVGFEAYKAHRQETPEDIIKSLPYIHELIEGFNIPTLFVDGYEADDVIGTLAKQAEKHDFITYMMTSDKDFGQLVSDRTFIYKPGKFGSDIEILGVTEVCNKFSIKRPDQVIDLLGLWGDASDNIPGIPGVGEVTAKKLLAEFDSVENLIANAGKIENEKLRQKIFDFQDQALMSKQLATIILDVPISFDEEKLRMENPDESRLKKLFDELEFRTFGQRVFTWISTLGEKSPPLASPPGESQVSGFQHPSSLIPHPSSVIPHPSSVIPHQSSDIQTTPHKYHLIDTPGKRADLVTNLNSQSAFCFDTETTGVDPNNAELVGISFSWTPHEACYIPLSGIYNEALLVLSEFKQLLENETVLKIGQNLKFDISVLKWYDIEVKGPLFDTMLAHYLIQPDMSHGMDFLAETYLYYKPVPIETLIGKKGQNQLSMRTVDVETIKEYASEDADITLQLKEVFEPLLHETNTRTLFDTIEVPLI
ncbi:MAG: 5'-3' exonuclease H3TH domain-containing protein, partial [Bacteroidota bacterium]